MLVILKRSLIYKFKVKMLKKKKLLFGEILSTFGFEGVKEM